MLYDDTVFLFLCPDGTFFITYRALQLCDKQAGSLSLLISHELAHYLLDHQVTRVLSAFENGYLRGQIFNEENLSPLNSKNNVKVYDPMQKEFEKRVWLQKYSCYYQ